MKYEKVSIIGAGNVAWHLGVQLERVGHHLCEIFSRDITKAENLASNFYTVTPQDHLDFSESEANIFIVCLPDDALDKVIPYLVVPEGAIVVHTAGSKGIDVLQGYDFMPGVFYPLQTLTRNKPVDFQDVPLLVEAEDADTELRLLRLAKSISGRVQIVTSEQRAVLHVAAVFASNFTNHMLHVASSIVEGEGLGFDLLHPLIAETVNKALKLGPGASQTGPAVRGDIKTIDTHLDYLAPDAELWRLYQMISQSIVMYR